MKRYSDYITRRYNRKRQYYRIKLGLMQFGNFPVLNLVWIFLGVGTFLLIRGMQSLMIGVKMPDILKPLFESCMMFFIGVLPLLFVVGLIQWVGEISARKDEALIYQALSEPKGIVYEPPILVYKKKIKGKDVTIREWYTNIPMERWKERKEAISDSMDIHLIGDISYGGRKKNKGNHIYFESAKGRKPQKRGVLYDDTF